MSNYRKEFMKQILATHGTVAAWADKHDVHTERFYNFIKGKYNPTVSTLEKWIRSVNLELSCVPMSEKKSKK